VVIAGLTLACSDSGDGDDRYCCWFEVDAGTDIDAEVGEEVTLEATISVSPISYDRCVSELANVTMFWRQSDDGAPRVNLSADDTRKVSFTPTESGIYTFCITIEDEICVPRLVPTFDCIYVRVGDFVCSPIADAGEDKVVVARPGTPRTITLDGSESRPDHACPDSTLTRYAWSLVSQPYGSNVTIQTPTSIQATADLLVPGDYVFQLEVQDSTGGVGADTMTVTLQQCGVGLLVTAIDALDGTPLTGAHVTVIDAAGDSYTADTDANGVAGFVALEPGTRQSITVTSDETVPPLSGAPGPDRPKYETTTVLGHCALEITVPMKRTTSGEAAPMGTVVAKVPQSLFDILPHSWRCTNECDTDADCDEEYYCESDPSTPCGPNPPTDPFGKCTPRSLSPSFSLGIPIVSGQFRVAMVVPVLAGENFTYRDLNRVFAPPQTAGDVWLGNLATDDAFLNGLAPALGRDPWGDFCVSTSDCPNTTDYVCEQGPLGGYKCKDKNPLRNIRLDLPAGFSRFVLVMGIVDVHMDEFIPELIASLTSGQTRPDLSTVFLATFDMHTLHVCLLWADVTANQESDISSDLSTVRADHCWNVDYQTQEVVITTAGGVTLYRVDILTNDRIVVGPDLSDFDPTFVNADTRLCSWLPATAPYEVMCDQGGGAIGPCNPRQIHVIPLPPDAECSFPYGLGLTALDVPVGHPEIPEGGRVFAGFEFDRCATHQNSGAEHLVPVEALDGSIMLSATQMYFRNLRRTDLGPFWEMPGHLAAQDRWAVMPATATLPPFTTMPSLDSPPPDAGLSVEVIFDPADPTVWPDPVWKRVFAQTIGLTMPQAANPIAYELTESALIGEDLKGVLLGKVDYEAAITWVDPWWRVYVPAGTTNITLPAGESPFGSGDYVWITPFGAGFGQPFDYDLFPTDILLGPMSQYSEDSWAVIVP